MKHVLGGCNHCESSVVKTTIFACDEVVEQGYTRSSENEFSGPRG